jgi:hypothetical protein
LADYRKNEYKELSLESRRQVTQAWGKYFAEWDYPCS